MNAVECVELSQEDFILHKKREQNEADVICMFIFCQQIKKHFVHWAEQTGGPKSTEGSISSKDSWQKVL
jgi:hypothetical protein